MGVHVGAGYGLVALMVFRLVWGVFGPEYSRVVSFIYPPRDTIEHLRGLLLLRPPHYVGHNPTGALMVFALTGVLIALVATGLLALGGEEKQGPLAAIIGYSVGSAAKRVHSWLTIVLLAMAAGHIAGVLAESVLGPDNLVRAIVTGWKKLRRQPRFRPRAPPGPLSPSRSSWRCPERRPRHSGGCPGFRRQPACARSLRMPRTRRNAGHAAMPLNPGLLPASSWAGLMAGLREHFGEDASLDDSTTRTLAAWLVENAAETFDTRSPRTASGSWPRMTRTASRPRLTGCASTPPCRRMSSRGRPSAARSTATPVIAMPRAGATTTRPSPSPRSSEDIEATRA